MGREQDVRVLLSQSELDILTAAAQQIGMDLSSFLRHAALALAGDIRPQRYTRYELNSIYREAASRGHVWEESKLRERGLPLYWSETWVRARLAEGKTGKQLAILSGSPERSVHHHLRETHGIRVFRTLTDVQIASIRERYAAGEPRKEIAADLGVSNTTIGKYLRDMPTEREREAREVRERRGGEPLEPVQPGGLLKPNVQGLRDWSERLFAERAATLTWPTSTERIADVLFEGNRAVARGWTGRMVKKGRLRRLTKGWFDLASKGETVSGNSRV
ncbi:Hin recombinase (plasmid) [Deinococcus metallilatus]|uniref:Hin recombinase n=1 Tax=Deinococcus metallilatus TaxID=1211322 RepID=A0AAJ5JZL0_9DEIO|nr:helix-turn-helix domain-containing protein [Deinococcus metallilatus]MBB5293416.1 transcriptional regulator with XRE-family HTH domain [Deinococcus metallilatus]QBY06510.1 Hin recombinase [Deinococcus metallilatus]RXJ17853.1 Hin recombinase [Deinococcus metallilatus]TLK32125.1 Hin recombinase [Deinococcus metallilatus]